MKIPFIEYHILAFFKEYDATRPLDASLQIYFRAHKSLGAKDRKAIGKIVYGMMRWKSYLKACAKEPREEISCYLELEQRHFQIPSTFSQQPSLFS